MNEPHHDSPGDQDLLRLARSDRAEPPAHLDNLVLAAARREARGRHRHPWLLPLATAATLVLTAGLALFTLHQPPETPVETRQGQALAPERVRRVPAAPAPRERALRKEVPAAARAEPKAAAPPIAAEVRVRLLTIRALIDAGEMDAARRALEDFRRDFPGYDSPALRELEKRLAKPAPGDE